ncbi:hypothetical protein GBAR_LOCUS11391, partial [Geodia barretti]
ESRTVCIAEALRPALPSQQGHQKNRTYCHFCHHSRKSTETNEHKREAVGFGPTHQHPRIDLLPADWLAHAT